MVGELAYRYAMEGRVPPLAMLVLVVEEKISAQVSVVIEGVRTKRSIYNAIVDEALSMGDASIRDGNERRKSLLCEIQLLNQFGSASWREHSDRRTLPPLLRAAKVLLFIYECLNTLVKSNASTSQKKEAMLA